mgnify:CR=1 FL=1
MKKFHSVKDIIYNEYLRAALLPILIIELTLLVMYFSITGYVAQRTKDTLLSEAKHNILEISKREVKNINQTIDGITEMSKILQKENERVLNSQDQVNLPNGLPVFGKNENGVFYKTKNNGGSSLFYSNITTIGPEERKKAIVTEAFDPIFKAVFESNPSNVGVYFNSHDSLCRYYPFLENVYDVFPADMDIPKYNFYYLADQKNNPSKKPVWTDAYLDPAGQGWMASCIVPIYTKNDFLEGVTGIDVTIDNIVKNILNLKLPWNAGAFLVDKNGVVLAMPPNVENILGMKELREQVYSSKVTQDTLKPEEFKLYKNSNPEIVKAMKALLTGNDELIELAIGEKKYIATHGKFVSTEWRLIVLVDEDEIFQPVYKLDQLSRKIGYGAFGFMVLFYMAFFTLLIYKSRRVSVRIANPINELANYTGQIKNNLGEEGVLINQVGIMEIDALVDNFNLMTKDLTEYYRAKTMELDEKNISLENALNELKVVQNQIVMQEKMAGLGQLAAGVAHEINNPMGFVYSNLATLKSHIGKINMTMEEILTIVHELYKDDPERQKQINMEIEQVKKQNKYNFVRDDSLELIDETLGGAERVKKIVESLRGFAHPLDDAVESVYLNQEIDNAIDLVWNELKYDVEVVREYQDIPQVLCNRGKMAQVFVNLIMNSKQAMEGRENSKIVIRTYQKENHVYMEFSDTGTGIKEENFNRVMEPFFTTKEVGKGTGLGLSIVHRIITDHDGHIVFHSEENVGTTVVIDLPIAE